MLIVLSYGIASAITTALLVSLPNRSLRFKWVVTSLTLTVGLNLAWLTELIVYESLGGTPAEYGLMSQERQHWNLYISSGAEVVPLVIMACFAWVIRLRLLADKKEPGA